MCTVKNNVKLKKVVKLAKLGEIVFHAKDLANLWNIKNKNTLHTTLKRYAKQGILFRIYRGFYSLKPIDQLDPVFLGLKALHNYSYISTETVLVQSGIVLQKIEQFTLVSSKSKKFSIGNNHYLCRQLADKFLYNDIGIVEKDGMKIATVERAAADLLYFNPKAYFDNKNLINWRLVKKIQKQIGYI